MNTFVTGRPRIVFLTVAAAIGVWVLWDSAVYRLVTYSLWADYWEHSAALTEWMRDLANPGNPHLPDDSSSSRYIPTFLVYALIGKLIGLDAIELMSLNAVVNYLLFAIGIYLFAREYFADDWAPFVLLLVLFAGWGVPWIWSNLYQLRSFAMVGSYPSTFVFALSLIAFWYTLRFLRCETGVIAGMLLLTGFSGFMFISHALTGVFGIVGCGLLACTERDAPLSMRMLVMITMLCGALLAGLWPYFPVWDVVLNQSDRVDDRAWQSFQGIGAMLARARSGEWWHMLYDPRQLTIALGPALLGVPICIWLVLRWREIFIPAGAAIMAVPYFGNVFYQIALAHRFLFYVVFFLHLAIVWAVLQLKNRWFAARAAGEVPPSLGLTAAFTALAVAAFASLAVGLLAADYRGQHLNVDLEWVDKRRFLPAGATVVDVYTELSADLPDTAVVIGNAKLTWPLPTFRGKVVALPENHENSLVPDEAQRIDAERDFLDAATADARRDQIVSDYRVTHVLVNLADTSPALMRWLDARATQIANVERYAMYALR
jgi:hypothetical protein